mgnify:CR=1 FL=1
MSDRTDLQTNKSADNQSANLSAYDIYRERMSGDIKHLQSSFEDLCKRHDTSADDALDKSELTLAVLSGGQDASLSKFFLHNYKDLKDLSIYRRDTPNAGLVSDDIRALGGLAPADARNAWLNYRDDASLHYRRRDAEDSGFVQGGLSGLGVSALVAASLRFVPGKFKAPLAFVAVASPVVGAIGGAGVMGDREEATHLAHINNKIDRALRISESAANSEYLSAAAQFKSVSSDRLKDLRGGFEMALSQDADANGYLDKREIRLSLMAGVGNEKVFNALTKHYGQLQFLSETFTTSEEKRGISIESMKMLTDEAYRSKYFAEERSNFLNGDYRREAQMNGAGYGAAGGVLCAGALGLAARYLPGSYKGAALVGACAVVPLGALTGAYHAERQASAKHEVYLWMKDYDVRRVRNEILSLR